MTQHSKVWMGALSLALALTLSAAPVRAAEVHKLLPDDTSAVITVNVRQVLDSELVKKYALDLIKQTIRDQQDLQQVLDTLGIDPLKDIDQIVVAAPELSENPKGLMIVTGRFDPDKVKAKAAGVARVQADVLKIHKAGNHEIYEAKIPDQQEPVFAAVADKNTIVAAPAKEYIVEALDKAAGKRKPALKDKAIGPLLERIDGKQGVWVAVGGAALEKNLPADLDPTVKDLIQKLDAVAGGLSVTDEVKAQFVLNAKDVQAARDMEKTIGDGINQGLGVLALLAGGQPELKPVIEIIKTIKTAAKGKTVTISVSVPADLIEKALNKGQ